MNVYVRDSELAPVAGALVKAKAIGSGSEPVYQDGGSVIVKEVAEHTSALGLVTLSLAANPTLLPANSYYRVTIQVPGERKERRFDIQVPDEAGPFDVEDLLHEPGTVDESALASEAATRAAADTALGERVDTADAAIEDLDDSANVVAPRDLNHLWDFVMRLKDGFAVSSAFTDLGVPSAIAAQTTEWGKQVQRLIYFDDLIFMGYGDPQNNTGPIKIISFDPAAPGFTEEQTFETQATWAFRIIGTDLFVLSEDPRGGSAVVAKRRTTAGVWTDLTIPVNTPAHVSDMASFGGDLYISGTHPDNTACLWVSEDDGATWAQFDKSATAGTRYNFVVVRDGKLYVEASTDTKLGSVTGTAKTWDGTTWGTAPSLLEPTLERNWGHDALWPGHHAETVQASDKVLMLHGLGRATTLNLYDGLGSRVVRRAVRDFVLFNDAPVVLEAGGRILYGATDPYDEWFSRKQAPPNATSVLVVPPANDWYVGTADGHLWKAAF